MSAQLKKIVESDEYIVGLGIGKDVDVARQLALGNLISKISVSVQSQFDFVISEVNSNGNHESEEKLNDIISSYSSACLKNVEEIVDKKKDEYHVYRYMTRSDMYAMFARRIGLARKWMYEGRRAEKADKIGDALQDYYWSLILLRSCPDGDIESVEDEYGEYNLMQHDYNQIKAILSNIKIKAISSEEEGDKVHVLLDISYKDRPVVNFNYRLSGDPSGDTYVAKDGLGEVVVAKGTKLSRIKLDAEYEGRNESNINPDMKSVIESTNTVPFSIASIKIDTKNCKQTLENTTIAQSMTGTLNIVNPDKKTTEESDCLGVIAKVADAIVKHRYDNVTDFFTSEGAEMFHKLIRYGDAKFLKKPSPELVKIEDGYVCRGFPMRFSFKGNKRVFTEDVVFYLNSDLKINEIAFGLGNDALRDIYGRGEWSETTKNVLAHFLETYKTAYALKRHDYINSIFSSDALIITGSVVYSKGKSDIGMNMKRHVKYTTQTKEEYLRNLDRTFKSNEFINIRFADNIVRRSNSNPDIYGIQIKQDYFSSNYGDSGYLFLMIDFADSQAPLIHVRTWQPDLDPTVKDGRIGIADFML